MDPRLSRLGDCGRQLSHHDHGMPLGRPAKIAELVGQDLGARWVLERIREVLDATIRENGPPERPPRFSIDHSLAYRFFAREVRTAEWFSLVRSAFEGSTSAKIGAGLGSHRIELSPLSSLDVALLRVGGRTHYFCIAPSYLDDEAGEIYRDLRGNGHDGYSMKDAREVARSVLLGVPS